MIKGLVIQASKNSFQVFCDNKTIVCKASNKLFLNKNSIITGDWVKIQKEDNFIVEVLSRKNQLIRPKISNVDIVFIVQSFIQPELCQYTLTKMIIFYQYFNIEPIIVLTKKDLVTNFKNIDFIKEYKNIGYKIIEVDYENFKKNEFLKIINKKIAILAGHSGVGKTTIVNHLNPHLKLKEGVISQGNKKGKHTTTSSTLYKMEEGFLCDTPGFVKINHLYFKDFNKFANLFYDFSIYSQKCHFKDCLHFKEINCFVKKQIGLKISRSRFDIYLSLLEKMNNDLKKDYKKSLI